MEHVCLQMLSSVEKENTNTNRKNSLHLAPVEFGGTEPSRFQVGTGLTQRRWWKTKTKLFGIFFYHIEKDTKEVGEKVKTHLSSLLLLLFRHKTNIKAVRSRGSRGLSQEANRFFVCCASPDIAAAGGILWNDLRHPTGENETMRTPLHLSRQFFVFFRERNLPHQSSSFVPLLCRWHNSEENRPSDNNSRRTPFLPPKDYQRV